MYGVAMEDDAFPIDQFWSFSRLLGIIIPVINSLRSHLRIFTQESHGVLWTPGQRNRWLRNHSLIFFSFLARI